MPSDPPALGLNIPNGDVSDYEIDDNLQVLTSQYLLDDRTPTNNQPTKEDAPELMTNLQCREDGGLDETLTGPSPIDFNDEEEWHSFSQGSPVNQPRGGANFDELDTPNGSMLSVGVGASWSPPVKRELLNEQGQPVFQSPLPSATLSSAVNNGPGSKSHQPEDFTTVGKSSKDLGPHLARNEREPASRSSNPTFGNPVSIDAVPTGTYTCTTSSHAIATFVSLPSHGSTDSDVLDSHPSTTEHAQFQQFHPRSATEHAQFQQLPPRSTTEHAQFQQLPAQSTTEHAQFQQLPPPSALVARLFPALKKEKRPLDLAVNPKKPKSSHVEDKVPSPTSSVGGDSGKGSMTAGSSAASVMNEELRRKLCLLETEIERFKSENASLEKLRKEREEVWLDWLCVCVCVHACGWSLVCKLFVHVRNF